MSPTQIAIRRTKLHAELELARKAGDFPRMQVLIGQDQRLLESVYGAPPAK